MIISNINVDLKLNLLLSNGSFNNCILSSLLEEKNQKKIKIDSFVIHFNYFDSIHQVTHSKICSGGLKEYIDLI